VSRVGTLVLLLTVGPNPKARCKTKLVPVTIFRGSRRLFRRSSLKAVSVFSASRFTAVVGFGLVGATSAFAVDLMPSFVSAPTGWTTDRYQPTTFTNIGTYQTRADVLHIGITSADNVANRGNGVGQAYLKGAFYNTQGMLKAVPGAGAGDTLSADLFIPTAWGNAANGNVRTDMWGIMVDAAAPMPAPNATRTNDYPIIGFTNYGGAARLQAFDSNTGTWQDLAASINYNAWNALSIKFTGSAFEYSVNGSLVYTDNTLVATAPSKFGYTIMQAYNFGDPALPGVSGTQDYTAHWANAAPVPEPQTYALTLAGLAFVGSVVARRRKAGRAVA
jgi:hypothetical protein